MSCTDRREAQHPLALLIALSGVATARVEGEREHCALIDPTRALLVRSGVSCIIETAAPAEQEIAVLELEPRALDGLDSLRDDLTPRLSFPNSAMSVPWSPRSTLRLLSLRRGKEADRSAIRLDPPMCDDLAALLRGVFADPDTHRARNARSGARAGAAHRELVKSAKVLIATAPELPHLLADVARAVCASRFHLEHVFQQEAGVPLHRFLIDVRLTLALHRLAREEELHLSTLALELGFSTHSHFTAAFRRALGRTPTAVRRELLAASVPASVNQEFPLAPGVGLRMLPLHASRGAIAIPRNVHTHALSLG